MMDFFIPINLQPLADPITYQDKLMLVGSCFTEHIGNRLDELKFNILQNPNGILFDPQSVATSLVSYIHNKQSTEEDLFYLNEVWQSWQHHSVFSNVDKQSALNAINESKARAHNFLKEANWIVITLGTSYSYQLLANDRPVANCHRAPANQFRKHLMGIEEINAVLDNCIHQLLHFNPNLKILFTISPVRHIRDGIVENNRSKARLIEVVHHLVNKFDRLHYFPAYELVTDVLRDYRFYDADLVHPNYAATSFVLDKFLEYCVDDASREISEEVKKITNARRHRAFQPTTNAHRNFLRTNLERTQELMNRHRFLDLKNELAYFRDALEGQG